MPNDIENEVTKANNGKGYWIDYGKASEWNFENGICYLMCNHEGSKPQKIWAIEILE